MFELQLKLLNLLKLNEKNNFHKRKGRLEAHSTEDKSKNSTHDGGTGILPVDNFDFCIF